MPPLEEECLSMKYKVSEPQFAFSVKWGYSVLPDHAAAKNRQRVSNPFADSTLKLWWVQVIPNNSSGASVFSMFLQSLRDPVCLYYPARRASLTSRVPRAQPQAEASPGEPEDTVSSPVPRACREQALKCSPDTPSRSRGRGSAQPTRRCSPRSYCALIRRLLHTWPRSFRRAAQAFLRKRKTIAQRRRKPSKEGPASAVGTAPPGTEPPTPRRGRPAGRRCRRGVGVGGAALAGISPGRPAGPTRPGLRGQRGRAAPRGRGDSSSLPERTCGFGGVGERAQRVGGRLTLGGRRLGLPEPRQGAPGWGRGVRAHRWA